MSAIHPTAIVETDSIGAEVTVGEFSVVRPGALLGDRVRIHPHVVIEAGVTVGDGVEVLPGSYLGRAPRATRTIAREPTFERRLEVGEGCLLGAGVVLYYDTEIGPESLLGDGVVIRELCRIGKASVIGAQVSLDRGVVIGDEVRVMTKAHLTGSVTVGDGAFIGPLVGTANDNSFGRGGFREEAIRGPSIEAGAMIGGGASLLPGVVVGRDAIVSAGAVVTRDVEPGVTVLGVPARPL